jgi:hypothetical protein
MNTDSYVKDCLLSPRQGETLFHVKKNGEVVVRLEGYAIIPKEDYERLFQSPVATKNT